MAWSERPRSRPSASRRCDRVAVAGRPRSARPTAWTTLARRCRRASPAGPDRRRPTGRSGRAADPDSAQVPLGHARWARARAVARPELAAWARVHRGHEREPRGEHLGPADADDGDAPVLERLAERLEDVSRELGQLVAQRACPGRRASPRRATAAARRRPCPRRRSCGAAPEHGRPAHESRDRSRRRGRGHHGRRQCRRVVEVGGSRPGIVRASSVLPDPGGPRAASPWPPARAISSARRAYGLPAHVREVDRRLVGADRPCRTVPRSATTRCSPRGSGAAWRAVDGHAPARPPPRGWPRAAPRSRAPRLASPTAVRRHDHAPDPASRQGQHHRQDARTGRTSPPSASSRSARPARPRPQLLGAEQDPDRDREVERGAGLSQLGRREVDPDPARRMVIAGVPQRAADPFPRLGRAASGGRRS